MALNRKRFYWFCQLSGWALYLLLNMILLFFMGNWHGRMIGGLLLVFALGILLTQLFRYLVIRFDWLRLPPARALLFVIPCNLLMGIIVVLTQQLINRSAGSDPDLVKMMVNVLNFTIAFFVWTLFYFLVHYIENYKKAEIESFRRQAMLKDVELNKLKSQLNPHFMFNSMNSIRALIDENPLKAKDSVTQLSNILRNVLLMGKNKWISFGDECRIVSDYLALEKTRFEERLQIVWEQDHSCDTFEVPPLMLQTLVENGIKHGIARLPGGGVLEIRSMLQAEGLLIEIRNSGHYNPDQVTESDKNKTGFGLVNTRERLDLLYGDRATLEITNETENTVLTRIFLPKNERT